MAADYPVTMAVRVLREQRVPFVPRLYRWEPHGGARASAQALDLPEHAVVKTLIFEDELQKPLCILMHGDREVSARNLARQSGRRSVAPCKPATADKHSGYQVGGTSPFGLRRAMPIFMERTIAQLERIFINGGARGFLVEIAPADLVRVLQPIAVEVATD